MRSRPETHESIIDVRADSPTDTLRRRRIGMLREFLDVVLARKATCRIIDLGGTINFWHTWRNFIDWRKIQITCLNIDPEHASHGEMLVDVIRGDVRDLSRYDDNAFDIAFSNSVIEHVGQWRDMKSMADEIRRVAPNYLVQTPHFWFPIEPHGRTPFLRWLPEPFAYRVVMMRKCGFWERARDVDEAVRLVQSSPASRQASSRGAVPGRRGDDRALPDAFESADSAKGFRRSEWRLKACVTPRWRRPCAASRSRRAGRSLPSMAGPIWRVERRPTTAP